MVTKHQVQHWHFANRDYRSSNYSLTPFGAHAAQAFPAWVRAADVFSWAWRRACAKEEEVEKAHGIGNFNLCRVIHVRGVETARSGPTGEEEAQDENAIAQVNAPVVVGLTAQKTWSIHDRSPTYLDLIGANRASEALLIWASRSRMAFQFAACWARCSPPRAPQHRFQFARSSFPRARRIAKWERKSSASFSYA